MTRRKFLGTTIAGSATVLAGTVFQKLALAVTSSATPTTLQMGGDLSVNRLGFGAMRLTGQGIWGWPPDRENAKKVGTSDYRTSRRKKSIGRKRFCPLSAFRTDTTSPTASRRMCSVIARKKRWDSCHGLQSAAVEEVR